MALSGSFARRSAFAFATFKLRLRPRPTRPAQFFTRGRADGWQSRGFVISFHNLLEGFQMTSKLAVATLLIFATQIGTSVLGNAVSRDKSVQADGTTHASKIVCSIEVSKTNWSLKKTDATVSVKIQNQQQKDVIVMPSLNLIALPKREGLEQVEYWAPFNMASGEAAEQWQKMPSHQTGPAATEHLLVARLKWARTISSVWPSGAFAQTIQPGEYSVQVQLEMSGSGTVHSNEVHVTITD